MTLLNVTIQIDGTSNLLIDNAIYTKYQIPYIDIGLFLFMILNNEVNKFALIMFTDPFF